MIFGKKGRFTYYVITAAMPTKYYGGGWLTDYVIFFNLHYVLTKKNAPQARKIFGTFFLYNIFAIFFYVFHIFTSKLSFYTIWSNGIILQPQKQTREKVIVGIFESKKVT